MDNQLILIAISILLILIYGISDYYNSRKKFSQQDVSSKVMKDYPPEQHSQVEKILNSYTIPENQKIKIKILQEAKGDIKKLDEIFKFVARYGMDDLTSDKAIQIFKHIETYFPVDVRPQVINLLRNGYSDGFKEAIHLMILEKAKGNISRVKELSDLAEETNSRYQDYRDVIIALNKK